jgi:hypothetical protein
MVITISIAGIAIGVSEFRRKGKLSPLQLKYGAVNSQIICTHCQIKGMVRTMPVQRKAGISGTKASAAVLTGGMSVLATGLSRKTTVTQAHCDNCGSTWSF